MSEENAQESLQESADQGVDASANEPVLSDEEKDALLDGIASGNVEVTTRGGSRYASVEDFVISPRAHIQSNSYPRLALIDKQIATLLSRRAEKLLNTPLKVMPGEIEKLDFGQLLEREEQTSLLISFTCEPLEGPAFLFFEANVVAQLVECFFGGKHAEAKTQNGSLFTAGERAVAQKFATEVLSCVKENYEPVLPIDPVLTAVHMSTDLIDGLEVSTEVLSSGFDLLLGETQAAFRVMWPVESMKALIPLFKDQKREADPAQDAFWNATISSGLHATTIGVHCEVGRRSMSLREIVELEVGDIIPIDDPRKTVLFANKVPVLKGYFGVHDERHAMEARIWLKDPAYINS